MKTENTWELPIERTRNTTRRAAYKKREVITYTSITHSPPLTPLNVIKIVTLNINGITAKTKVVMLTEFVRHDIDILFAQEVTSTEVLNLYGYENHLNIGALICGTAILVRLSYISRK
jgi:hypothetical protein